MNNKNCDCKTETALILFKLYWKSHVDKVSFQGVIELEGHFATLFQGFNFMKDFFLFLVIDFQKEKANTLIILIVKSLQIELHSTNLPEKTCYHPKVL